MIVGTNYETLQAIVKVSSNSVKIIGLEIRPVKFATNDSLALIYV